MTNPAEMYLVEAAGAIKRGEISSYELTKACLERSQQLDARLNAFITLNPDQALASARAADRKLKEWSQGESDSLPPLLGTPIAVKDVLCVQGFPCTSGSRILEGFFPPYNATSVERLLQAGVIAIGKTNTDEFAMGSSTENSAYFTTRNPWNLEHVPGGSSGGSAAAVAASMVPAALGTDTGGSIRQPASYCGITGIKPTYGRISRYGLVAYGSSLDVVGALARNVEDTAVLFSIMAGCDPLDATSSDLPATKISLDTATRIRADASIDRPLEGLRVGVPQEYFIKGIQIEVDRAVNEAIGILETLGAEIKPVSLPHTEYALPVYYIIAPAEASANLARYDGVRYGPRSLGEQVWDVFFRTRGEKFGAEVKRRIMLGTYALSAGYYEAYYGQAQKVRTLIKRDFEQAFESVDVIAAPVAPSTAFRIGEHRDDPLAMYLEDVFTLPANLAGIPGLTFPVGFDQDDLPIGIQLMGGHFQEELLFQTAYIYQQTTNWHLRRPNL
jgi:aspartyl-tRNA(Asn)/glutamyl-tRNA(Gln) amidotransferase subunit A